MNKNANLRERIDRWNHMIMPKSRLRLDKEVKHAWNWIPNWSSDTLWQVEHTHNRNSFIVDTSKKTCTSNFWELVGIPCRHAVAALGFRNQSLEDFVDDYYSKDTCEKCYGYNVSHINGQDMWLKVDMEKILPPSYKRVPRQSKKLRRREPDEDPNKVRTQTSYGVHGYNARSCTSQVVDPEAKKRKFEMLAANLAAPFTTTQAQPNLVINGPVSSSPSQPNHSAPVTSAHGEIVTSSQIDNVPDYILSAPIPTTDDVPAAPVSAIPRVLKPIEFNIPFHNDYYIDVLHL
ncbi:hypothetical protein KIW84_033414 [Lathyrus oleraceus]|uniref:SWIM-type domain-containing protein n=1 Tax=Pisum sativum TaxID=3888 RepID=A0A9D4XWU7_PEA|nr:hypothetical protein KIW84_033414 [Pisum sativum]